MVYARTIGGATLTFQVSGRLWRNSMVMRDRETGSMWSHVLGTAIQGSEKGRQLERLASVQTTWSRWKQAHPSTLVLKKDRAVAGSPYQRYFTDPTRAGMFRARWLVERMPPKTLVVGLALGIHAVAVRTEVLAGGRVVEAKVGGERVVIVEGSDGGARAFLASVSGRSLEFTGVGTGLRDVQTGSTWDPIRGLCTGGKLAGSKLQPVPVTRAFWFAWSSFYPNTAVVDGLKVERSPTHPPVG